MNKSLKNNNIDAKLIIVNNEVSKNETNKTMELCNDLELDFINTTNNGYSSGNNIGIDYVINKYNYEFLIVSNPDIRVLELDNYSLDEQYFDKIIGPSIANLRDKQQNPFYFREYKLLETMNYHAFKKDQKWLLLLALLFNKIFRLFKNKKIEKEVYALHGSFLIFGKYALTKLYPVFDPKYFLFCEENDLAKRASELNIKMIYKPSIKVQHIQDVSMKFLYNKNEVLKKSFIYYYEKWYM